MKRLNEHNRGSQLATKLNIPYELIFYSGFKSRKDALNCESYFKTTSGWRRLIHMLKDTLKEN
jgi:predicted GIY-YIG superfamily endonuclease